MKKIVLVIGLLLQFEIVFGQNGIVFDTTFNSWNEVVQKAQQIHRPIFIDLYTTWCGPCKHMDAEVFPQQEVGRFYNAHYLCIKLDAEKGYGISVNKEQQVNAYPSYLFFTPSGELLRIAVGYRKAPGFIAVGRAVMEEYRSGRRIKTMENKIKSGNYNTAFLVDYIKMLAGVRKTNIQAFENYLHTLSDDSLFSVTTRRFVENYYRGWLSSNSLGFSVLLHGYEQYPVRDFEVMKPWSIIDGRLRDDLAIAIAQKDSSGMEDIIKSYRKIDSGYQYFQLDKGFVYCYYFAGIGDTHNFMKHLKLFVTNNVTSEKDGTQQRDELKKYKNALKLKFGIDNEKDLPAKDKWFLKSYFCFYRLVLIRLQSIQYEYTHYLKENDQCKNVLSGAMQIAIKNYERYSPNYNKALVGYYE